MTPDLAALKAATESACREAALRSKELGGGVNWADLHCHEARRWENHNGESGFSVLVDEASPDAWRLSRFLSERLTAAGFVNVEIELDW